MESVAGQQVDSKGRRHTVTPALSSQINDREEVPFGWFVISCLPPHRSWNRIPREE